MGLAQLTPPPAAIAVPPAPKVGQATANVGWFEQSKYGIFAHYVQGLTMRPNGTYPSDVDSLAAEFNATQFAADVNSFGADYVIFTAWHLAMRPLYPSAVNESWRPGQSADRDVIRDLINALKPYGIRLVLYIHATDGHDFSSTDQALTGWNDRDCWRTMGRGPHELLPYPGFRKLQICPTRRNLIDAFVSTRRLIRKDWNRYR